MADLPDYILDLASLPSDAQGGGDLGISRSSGLFGKPWIAIHWRCCHTYSRIYRNKDETAYEGRCPQCGKSARAGIGKGGSSARIFSTKD